MIARRVAGETVLVPLAARASDPEFKSARLFVLNETGGIPLVASRLAPIEPRTGAELDTSSSKPRPGRAQADVEVFLVALRDIGAVRQVTDSQAE